VPTIPRRQAARRRELEIGKMLDTFPAGGSLHHQDVEAMNYEGIEYVIRAGLGRNEWAVVIYFPSASDAAARSSVLKFQGTREEASSKARKRIRNWLRYLKSIKGNGLANREENELRTALRH
jgi:hypothetical protein